MVNSNNVTKFSIYVLLFTTNICVTILPVFTCFQKLDSHMWSLSVSLSERVVKACAVLATPRAFFETEILCLPV